MPEVKDLSVMVKLIEDSPQKPEPTPDTNPAPEPTPIIVPVQEEKPKPELTEQVVLL